MPPISNKMQTALQVKAKEVVGKIRIPQLRALKCMIDEEGEPQRLTRQQVAEACGFSKISGTVTRIFNGVPPLSSSGDERPGLIDLGCTIKHDIDVDGLSETVYEITSLGLEVLRQAKDLPKLRDKNLSVNHRYKRSQNNE